MRFSVIIPALHEAHQINDVVAHVRARAGAEVVEVLVVDGDPEGSTSAMVADSKCVCLTAPTGRASQMNAGAGVATGEILLFLHADTRLPENAFTDMAMALERKDVLGGAFGMRYDTARFPYPLIGQFVTARTRITREPYGDQALFVPQTYFERVGGFADLPLMEDVEFVRRMRRRGDRLVILPSTVITSARRIQRRGVVRMCLRVSLIQALFDLGVSPVRLAKLYAGAIGPEPDAKPTAPIIPGVAKQELG